MLVVRRSVLHGEEVKMELEAKVPGGQGNTRRQSGCARVCEALSDCVQFFFSSFSYPSFWGNLVSSLERTQFSV